MPDCDSHDECRLARERLQIGNSLPNFTKSRLVPTTGVDRQMNSRKRLPTEDSERCVVPLRSYNGVRKVYANYLTGTLCSKLSEMLKSD